MQRMLLLFSILLLTVSCKKEDLLSEAEKASFIGKWSLVNTSGGIAGILSTPALTGEKIKLIMQDGHYFIYTNGALTSEGTFEIELRKDILINKTIQVIKFSNDQHQIIESFDGFNLTFWDGLDDGFTSTYKRII